MPLNCIRRFSQWEGDFKFRPPLSFKGWVFFFILVFNMPKMANTRSCAYDESPKCIDSSCSNLACIKCLVCDPGKGVFPQCGSTLKQNTTMACLPCKSGMYSDQKDFGSCHACDVCVGQETLQECNAFQNTKCKEGCKDGFQWNDIYQLCEEIPSTPRKETVANSSHKSTSIISTAEVLPKITSTMNMTVNETAGSKPTSIKPPTSHKYNGIIYALVIVFLLALLAIPITIMIIRGTIRIKGIFATDQDTGTPFLKDIHGAYSSLLTDLPCDLEHDITLKISNMSCLLKGWKEIGSLLKVSKRILEGIDTTSYHTRELPGKLLLDFLKSSRPHLTIKEFVVALESAKRKDVISCILEAKGAVSNPC